MFPDLTTPAAARVAWETLAAPVAQTFGALRDAVLDDLRHVREHVPAMLRDAALNRLAPVWEPLPGARISAAVIREEYRAAAARAAQARHLGVPMTHMVAHEINFDEIRASLPKVRANLAFDEIRLNLAEFARALEAAAPEIQAIAQTPPARPTGLAAQRSPYGPRPR